MVRECGGIFGGIVVYLEGWLQVDYISVVYIIIKRRSMFSEDSKKIDLDSEFRITVND